MAPLIESASQAAAVNIALNLLEEKFPASYDRSVVGKGDDVTVYPDYVNIRWVNERRVRQIGSSGLDERHLRLLGHLVDPDFLAYIR